MHRVHRVGSYIKVLNPGIIVNSKDLILLLSDGKTMHTDIICVYPCASVVKK